jgi:hypothetical protein
MSVDMDLSELEWYVIFEADHFLHKTHACDVSITEK